MNQLGQFRDKKIMKQKRMSFTVILREIPYCCPCRFGATTLPHEGYLHGSKLKIRNHLSSQA
jgi:hypothetical protein